MSFAYSSRKYSEGFYGGKAGRFAPIGAGIEVYNTLGELKGYYQQGVGNYLGCEFTLDITGCRDFILFFADSVDIDKKDIIKIKIFNSDDYFFTGVIRTVPIDGSTKLEYNYSGFGLNDYLLRLNTGNLSYANKTINYIVNDLLDNIITVNSPINKNASKISALTTSVTGVTFKYVSVQEALDQLKKIANADGNDYLVGVDSDGDFMFQARDTDIKVNLAVGKSGQYGITDYEPQDSYEAKSKLYVLKKDGTFWNSYTSLEDIDTFEIKLTAPDINDADIDNWAEGQLKELEQESRQAAIEWQIATYNPMKLIADGNIRIISNIPPTPEDSVGSTYGSGVYGSGYYGGVLYNGKDLDDELKIKEVTYIINDSQAVRKIQLGSVPVELGREIINVNQNIEALRVSLGR